MWLIETDWGTGDGVGDGVGEGKGVDGTSVAVAGVTSGDGVGRGGKDELSALSGNVLRRSAPMAIQARSMDHTYRNRRMGNIVTLF